MSLTKYGRLAVIVLALSGCSCTNTQPDATSEFKLGDLLENFQPPALADLEAKVEWVEQPVLDALELRKQYDAEHKELVPVAEALKLKNDSPENNDKILSSLGKLPAAEGDVNWDAEIVRHSAFEVKSTNPILASSTTEFDVSGMTSFGLFGFDWNFKPFASKDSVVSWHTSKDGLYDKIILRDDLTWSDGKKITAHDVVFSFKLIMTDAVPVPAQRSGTDKLKWIEAYDDHTLIVFHKEALATNVWNVNFSVIPEHVYNNPQELALDPTLQHSDFWTKYEVAPVTGGPYMFASRSVGSEAVLLRRDSYYTHEGKQVRDKPYFAKVRFRFVREPAAALLQLKGGDLDEMILTPAQWKTETDGDDFYEKCTKAYATEWVSFHFMWNSKTPFFEDKRVRWAMSYAFDHDEMLKTLRYGLDAPCTGMFHPDSRWSPPTPPQPLHQDLAKAEKLLDEAGWTDSDGDGVRDKEIKGKKVPFDFSLIVVNRPERIEICNLMKQSLQKIGIQCTVRPLEFSVLQEKTQKKQFQASFGGWGTGTDPDTSVNIWGTGEERNYVSYSNPKVDDLFARGRKEMDPEKRAAIYQELALQVWEDQPYTWLFYQNAYYGFSKELRGYMFSPRGPYNYGPGFSSLWRPAMQ